MLLILIGNSGSGKTTIAEKLKGFKKEITTTTREIRYNEIEGVSYNYVSEKEFNKMKKENLFIETDGFQNKQYGTPKSILNNIKDENKVIILTPKGASKIQKYCKEREIETKIVILKIEKEEIKKRLKDRGDKKETISKRIKESIIEEAYELEKKGELSIDKTINTMQRNINDTITIILQVTSNKASKRNNKKYKKIKKLL